MENDENNSNDGTADKSNENLNDTDVTDINLSDDLDMANTTKSFEHSTETKEAVSVPTVDTNDIKKTPPHSSAEPSAESNGVESDKDTDETKNTLPYSSTEPSAVFNEVESNKHTKVKEDAGINVQPNATDEHFGSVITPQESEEPKCCCCCCFHCDIKCASISGAIVDFILLCLSVFICLLMYYDNNQKMIAFILGCASLLFLTMLVLNSITACNSDPTLVFFTAVGNLVCKWYFFSFSIIFNAFVFEYKNNLYRYDVTFMHVAFSNAIFITLGFMYSNLGELQLAAAKNLKKNKESSEKSIDPLYAFFAN